MALLEVGSGKEHQVPGGMGNGNFKGSLESQLYWMVFLVEQTHEGLFH